MKSAEEWSVRLCEEVHTGGLRINAKKLGVPPTSPRKAPPPAGGFTVTKAGIITAQLIEEAGFKPNRQYGTMFPAKH